MNLLEELKKYQEDSLKEFSDKIIPNSNILGIRNPILKNLAKEMVKEGNFDFFNEAHYYHEEFMVHVFMLIYIKDKELVYKEIDRLVPMINNWAMCDGLMNVKIIDKNREYFYPLINKYKSKYTEFEVRFVLVMLLSHYLVDEYIDDVFKIIEDSFAKDYYARMAKAWLIAECMIKYREKTLEFFKNTHIDSWTYNKAIQKCLESFRISDTDKEYLRSIKR